MSWTDGDNLNPITPDDGADESAAAFDSPLHRDLAQLRRRLIRSANVAIDMLEASLFALWRVDHAVALDIRRRDDRVDDEEVAIEQVCLRLMTLQQPYGQDFRLLTFCLKVNADIERVADHATSVAKVTLRLDPSMPPKWPVSLTEIGDRVPVMCHTLLRAVLDEDVGTAKALLERDEVIDRLDKRLFEEVAAWIRANPALVETGLLMYRLGRELERVGDLVGNIAEEVVYLATGEIIRHQHSKQTRRRAGQS